LVLFKTVSISLTVAYNLSSYAIYWSKFRFILFITSSPSWII